MMRLFEKWLIFGDDLLVDGDGIMAHLWKETE
jgi:hypothetical protein